MPHSKQVKSGIIEDVEFASLYILIYDAVHTTTV